MLRLENDSSAVELGSQVAHELQTKYSLQAAPAWLEGFLSTVRQPPPPLTALASTAKFRLLNTNLTQSLCHPKQLAPPGFAEGHRRPRNFLLLPKGIVDVNVKLNHLDCDVPVQILDIYDIGSSKWSQIEAIERYERGEDVKGREVIRNVPVMNDPETSDANDVMSRSGHGSGGQRMDQHGSGGRMGVSTQESAARTVQKKSNGPHKVLLQDAAGTIAWGFEATTIPRLFLTNTLEEGGLQIGAKLLLKKGLVVRRGLIMLEPEHAIVLGGKVEDWDKQWRAKRKQRLIDDLKKEKDKQ